MTNITREFNGYLCSLADECLFYTKGKEVYSANETDFYIKNCIMGGGDCGLKRNHDITEKLKERIKRRLDTK